MVIDLTEVRQVAQLARLELSEAELLLASSELTAILDYVDLLRKLDTIGVEPLAHPLPVQDVFREDVPFPSLTVEEALRNAPARIGDYFAVPAVFDK